MKTAVHTANLIFLTVWLMLWCPAVGKTEPPKDEAIAVINGEPITLSDVEQRVAFQVYRLRGNIYQLLKRETEKIVEQKLLEAEARRRNLTVEALLKIEVDEKVAAISDDELQQYLREHSQNTDATPRHKERTRTYLIRRAAIQRKMDYIAALRTRAEVKFLLTPPEPPRLNIDTQGEPWRGHPDAPITVAHFAGFNCEQCAKSVGMIQTLMRDYPDQIRWVHRNFFSMRDEVALSAAQLGEAAHEKGRFWEFHDAVFNSEARLDQAELRKIADKLNLEWASFQEGQFEKNYLLKVKKDIRDGQQYGATSVPVMFVNGLYFSPTFSYARLKAMVAEEINRTAGSPQTRKALSVSKP